MQRQCSDATRRASWRALWAGILGEQGAAAPVSETGTAAGGQTAGAISESDCNRLGEKRQDAPGGAPCR